MKTDTKNKISLTALMITLATMGHAQTLAGGQVDVNQLSVNKEGKHVKINIDLNLNRLTLAPNRGWIFTPMLVNGNDTLTMPPAEVMGRKRYIYYQRTEKTATNHPLFVTRRKNGKEQTAHYVYQTPYARWMQGSRLYIGQDTCGCDQALIGQNLLTPTETIDLHQGPWNYQYAYVQPKAEDVKTREVSGSARLNFVIDTYDIRPTFGNNEAELKKIRESIDLVRNDKDVTLTGIELHGYASPDGSYAHNEVLAHNRTEALKNYLKDYYKEHTDRLFTVHSTAEDWDGVRQFVTQSSLSMKDDLLSVIDGRMQPDEKDRYIARTYPELYRGLIVKELYPSLRRTDYKVYYHVRNFNLEEARRIIKERPQNLSLNEMYLVANSYEKGSAAFNQVFDVAVRMYPESEPANLNAACVALSRGDKASAATFLARAGNSPEAENARGVLAAQNEDYPAAKTHFEKALSLPEAQQNLTELKKRM